MTFKTILLHVNDERRVASLVTAAAQIAEKFESHVIGLYVLPPVPTYGATAMGAGLIKSGLDAFRKEADRVKAAFEEAAKAHPIVAEWRVAEDRQRGVAETVMDHGRAADLIIAGQRDPEFDFSALLDVPERLAIESGRPLLVVPRIGIQSALGSRITVAWNGRREAARATFDALPLLKTAKNVRIVWVNPQADQQRAADLPTAEIAATLARHGVNCEAATTAAPDIGVGDAILSGLCDDGTDLLVMGAYGHSRFREMVFGGATQHIMRHMTIPVLLSH
jgi:nucleotide-binding universal stress UspA family protein